MKNWTNKNHILSMTKTPTKFTFWFHYNVPHTKQKGKTQAGVFYRGQYNVYDNVICNVPTRGMHRAGKRPNWVVGGEIEPHRIKVVNNICHIG